MKLCARYHPPNHVYPPEQQCVTVDCAVSEWGEWTVVQNRRARRRHVIVKPNTLGEQCPPLIEVGNSCSFFKDSRPVFRLAFLDLNLIILNIVPQHYGHYWTLKTVESFTDWYRPSKWPKNQDFGGRIFQDLNFLLYEERCSWGIGRCRKFVWTRQ